MSVRVLGVVGLLGLVALAVASCTSSPSRTSTPPPPHLAAGQTGVFASIVEVSKSGTPSVAPNGKLVALSASDGSLVWSAPTSGIATAVLFANGTLFASQQAVASSPTASAPTSTVEAVRASDGTRLWQSPPTTFATPIAADSSAVYVLSVDPQAQQGNLQALRASDGQSLWKDTLPAVPLGAGTPAAGVLADGTLFLSTVSQTSSGVPSGGVTAVRASDGKSLWSTPLPGQFGAPAESNGTVYVSGMTITPATGQTGPMPGPPAIVALRASDGTQLWSHPLASQVITEGVSPPVVSGSAVCAAMTVQSGSPTGPTSPPLTASVVALNPATGAQLWQAPAPGFSTSLIGDGTAVYLSSVDLGPVATKPAGGAPSTPASALTAYRASDGTQLWTQPHPQDSVRAATIANGTLVALVVSQGSSSQISGAVESLAATDGSKQWAYSVADGGPAAAVLGAV